MYLWYSLFQVQWDRRDQEEVQNTKGVIRIRKSKKEKPNPEDRVTRTPLKLGVNSDASEC